MWQSTWIIGCNWLVIWENKSWENKMKALEVVSKTITTFEVVGKTRTSGQFPSHWLYGWLYDSLVGHLTVIHMVHFHYNVVKWDTNKHNDIHFWSTCNSSYGFSYILLKGKALINTTLYFTSIYWQLTI